MGTRNFMDRRAIGMPKLGSSGALLIGCLAACSWAQTPSKAPEATPTPSLSLQADSARKSPDLLPYVSNDEGKGEGWGVYQVTQVAEFGGRISGFTGNQGTWDTFVNMGSGPRLLEYTLEMHAPTHNGLLFDDLSFENFGYGGDPNDVSHFRLSKGALYSFTADFRRDQQVFDYDLLANPLNPSTGSNPSVPILTTPHEFLTERRMTDTKLSLFPISPIRFTLDWSRVVQEGDSFSTTHQGTEGLVFQPTLNTSDTYTFGVSLRFIPRTSINYDQFYTYYKGDTTGQLASPSQEGVFGIPSFTLSNGIPVSGGVAWNTPAGQPCATPVIGGFFNPSCNAFTSYSRFGRNRNDFPTEQISIQSNYFRHLDLSARFSYSDAEADTPDLGESFGGLISRSNIVNFNTVGSAIAKRISASGDFGATLRITEKLRLVDTFRYYNFRIPGSWNQTTTDVFALNMLTCPPPFTGAGCLLHTASTGPDVTNDLVSQFLAQEDLVNTVETEYDFTRKVTSYLGFRYEHRDITDDVIDNQNQTFLSPLPNRGACAGKPVVNGVCTVFVPNSNPEITTFVPIHAYSAIFGIAARPTQNLRLSFDTEQYYADNTFTRISPRHLQSYKARASYRANGWVNFGTALNIRENRNDTADIGNLQHNRSYAFNTVIAPPEGKWGFDLGYDYNDIFSQTNICFVSTPTTPGTLSCGSPFLEAPSVYKETANVVNSSVFLHPVSRVNLVVGYTVTSSNGSTLILNPNAPTGPLAYNYHLPTAALSVELTKKLVYKTGWNYYDYNEKSDPGPTLPRDFRGNTFTLSLRYSM